MEFEKEHIVKMNGFTLHMMKTEKYKTNTIVWKMKAPLQKETATLRALLPLVMQSSTKKYSTTGALRSYLDELYGASFYADTSKKGEENIISFTLEIANEKYLQDKTPLLHKGVEFLTDVLLDPNVTNDQFDDKTMKKEKRGLKERIHSLYDDKMRYATVRLVEEMCQNEPYAIQPTGELDEIDKITGGELYEYYKQAFNDDQIDLYIIGDINLAEVQNLFSVLSLSDRVLKQKNRPATKEIRETKVVKEHQDLNQGKLNIGCRTNILFGDREYFALQMFNGIFGGFAHSKLFINVREKESLAYYAASRIESHKGLLMIMSGIENQNFEKAVSIIKEQLEMMRLGEFSEKEIEQTKAVIKNELLETLDSAKGFIEVLYNNYVGNENITLEDWLKRIQAVSKEEIIEVAKKIEMDTIYFLAGTEGE
ncbi:EF-P 5-aminopentanol modification-associated protein YfmF [Lederbergia galactosidilytica]|uniref:Zinc protease n=1 Tax=Lederbergia galactosidilytica TaxID=217031 RepID=A0A177ZXR6_9BACI|nr:pitrilysin family protein [Lederbergia galactosidilytica]MBP1913595.1 putative Zn-dependent peptidase [Lederbergia galactosidilytica]OAK72503.1 zinc protease [Lederbergia galactosidilytica]